MRGIKLIKKIKKSISRFLINHIFLGTRYFGIKSVLLRFSGYKIGKNTKIVGPINYGNAIKFNIGDNCWIGKNISFDGNGIVNIENNVDIGPNCVINTGGHEIGTSNHRAGKGLSNTITIKNGVWIGTNCIIINNSTIENGSVVGAGAVVIGDVSCNTLVAGVPAKIKKKYDF